MQKSQSRKEVENRIIDFRKSCLKIFDIRKSESSLNKRQPSRQPPKSSSNFDSSSSIKMEVDSESDENSDIVEDKGDITNAATMLNGDMISVQHIKNSNFKKK